MCVCFDREDIKNNDLELMEDYLREFETSLTSQVVDGQTIELLEGITMPVAEAESIFGGKREPRKMQATMIFWVTGGRMTTEQLAVWLYGRLYLLLLELPVCNIYHCRILHKAVSSCFRQHSRMLDFSMVLGICEHKIERLDETSPSRAP